MNRSHIGRHFASALVLVLLIVLAAGSEDSSSSRGARSTTSSQARSTPVGQKRIAGDNWFGCTDREYHGKLVGYAVQGDNQAFSSSLAAGIVTGICTMFKNGEVVYIADTAIFSGLVKVRRRGETTEYWTNMEAVK